MKWAPILLWAGLAVTGTARGQGAPAWWDNPIREDAGHYFIAATADSAEGSEAAFTAAREAALAEIARRLGVTGNDRVRAEAVTSRIRNWTIHAREEARVGGRTRVWIILRYPKEEYARLEEWISGGEREFARARELAAAGKSQEALEIASALLERYPAGTQPFLDTDAVLLLAGDCAAALGQGRAALAYYQRLLDLGSSHPLFARARAGYLAVMEKHNPENEWLDRLRGKSAAAVAGIEEAGALRVRVGGALTQLLGQLGLEDKSPPPPSQGHLQALQSWVEQADTEMAMAFFIRLGEPGERTVYANSLKVYPATCEILLRPGGGRGGALLRESAFFEASDRHGRKEVIEQILLKNCVATVVRLLKQHQQP